VKRARANFSQEPSMPELSHLPSHATAAQIFAGIDADGGVIVDDFIAKDLFAQLSEELMPLVDAHQPGTQLDEAFWTDFHGRATKRITGLAGRSDAWAQLLCEPRYKAMGDHYLGEDGYWLNTGQLICIGPNETPQILHRDELNWPSAAGREEEITITAIFALTDFTLENGATLIAPGSHRWPGATPEVKPEQCCQAVMRAGSALLYSGKVIHGGGPNHSSDQWRVGLHAGFVSGWLRAEENHQLTTSLEQARRLPEHVQRLLGFRSFAQPMGGRLGLVDYEDAALLL
jgi:hypothetical protein